MVGTESPGSDPWSTEEGNVRPREFDHDDVLRIAFDQFWRKGVRGTQLSDIARDAGVQRGSLYNAFGSKEALFLQAYERYAGDYVGSIQKVLGSGTSRKRITALVRDSLSAGAERGEFSGDPEISALHIITVTRGLAVLERAYGDEAEL